MSATILCIKWGTAFDATEVNLLFRACRANVTGEMRFVCLTDERDGLIEGIEVRDIPDIGLDPSAWYSPGVWRKISLFSPELADLGRVLFIDLDMMIMGNLNPFFDTINGCRFLNVGDSWRPHPTNQHQEVGTGVFSFDVSANIHVLDTFNKNRDSHMQRWPNEQAFVGAHADTPSYWAEGLVLSFKRHLCFRYGKGVFAKLAPPPVDTAIVAFHGRPRPIDTMEKPIWGAFPHLHIGQPQWIKQYRLKYGTS